MSMFGSLSHKIAHTSTIPSLGNQDLRALQDLIIREKEVITSIQRLSGDLIRANEALKAWGQGEGVDLGDVLTHSTGGLNHIVSALNGFANHEQNIRAHMKEIRTREENLDDLRKRRKNVMIKAEAAEKKLNKMGSENKYLAAQTNLLAQLTDEMRQLDTEILSEEARVGDFKRRVAKQFMSLKFGGLLEFAEKATIVGELGKLIIDEIPLETTLPGNPRVPYHGYEKTVQLGAEIARCINEVRFMADPDHSALAALKGRGELKDNASELSELVPPPPLTTVIEPDPEFGGLRKDGSKLPSPSSPRKSTFGAALGRKSSPERAQDVPLNLPVGSREPYQAHSRRISSTDPPNLALPELGGPSFSASLGIISPPTEEAQSVEGLSVAAKATTNSGGTIDRTLMNVPSEFGGRPAAATNENRSLSSFTPPAPPTPASKPQFQPPPLLRQEEPQPPVVMNMTPSIGPPPGGPPTAPKPQASVAQSSSQTSTARVIDPPGTKITAGRFAAFPLKSRRATNPQQLEAKTTIDASPAPPQSVAVAPPSAEKLDGAPMGGPIPKTESPRPSVDRSESPMRSGITKPTLVERDDSMRQRVRFAATPPITPATATFTEDSSTIDDNHDANNEATEETHESIDEYGQGMDPNGRPLSMAVGLGTTNKNSNRLSVITPLKKKPSFEPSNKASTPEPVKDVDEMSESELNAMIDAMAAQVGQGLSPSSQISPMSGSPPSSLPTPIVSRIYSSPSAAPAPIASGSPLGSDSSLAVGGRISASAFKRPMSRVPGLPSNPKAPSSGPASRISMAPAPYPRVVSTPEPRKSIEEVSRTSPPRPATPPPQAIPTLHGTPPSPLPAPLPVVPAEPLAPEIPPTPPMPTPPTTTDLFRAPSPLPSSLHSHTSLPPAAPRPSFPPPPLPSLPTPNIRTSPSESETPEMDFEMILTPEYEQSESTTRPMAPALDTSEPMISPLASSPAIDSPRTHRSPMSSSDKSVDMPLPPGAGPPRRPGEIILPDSTIPGAGQGSPGLSQSPERSHSRPVSASWNIPPALKPGTPHSASPAAQNFAGVGSSALGSHGGTPTSPKLVTSPSVVGPPSLLPIDPYSPIFDLGALGDARGYGAVGLPTKEHVASNAGYGEGKFATNLEEEYEQEKKPDPKRGSGSWR